MGVRLFFGIILAVLMPGLAEAADCIAIRQGDVAIVQDARCADLRVMSRAGDDPRSHVEVAATWIEFVQPSGPAEWRYNEWVRKQVPALDFDKPIQPSSDRRSADRFAIESFYRSDRLISARYARRVCCGADGSTVYGSINVDNTRWTLFSPDDLVSLGATANACWRQFGDDRERGRAFGEAYPLERPWADRDFEIRQIGHFMRDMIGSVVVNPVPSRERTRSLFISALKDQARWSFSEQGARIDFGELLGFTAGPFFCVLPNVDLRAIAHPGAAIPP